MRPLTAVCCLVFIFLCASVVVYLVSLLLPSTGDKYRLRFPSTLEDLKDTAHVLKQFKDDHKFSVMMLFCVAYLYKQTFAIPGSVFLNLLAGALFGLWKSFMMTCTLTACGATCCFMLSKFFGKSILFYYFPDKFSELEKKVKNNQDGMFFFLLCLRLFPMSPNWFLNMSSPVIGIPVTYFFPSVLIGLMPYNFICCQTGCILSEVTSIKEIFTLAIMFKLVAIAAIVALPGIVVKQWKKYNCLKAK